MSVPAVLNPKTHLQPGWGNEVATFVASIDDLGLLEKAAHEMLSYGDYVERLGDSRDELTRAVVHVRRRCGEIRPVGVTRHTEAEKQRVKEDLLLAELPTEQLTKILSTPRPAVRNVLAAARDYRRRQKETKPTTSTPKLNRTNEAVDWAAWTWNPVTGCLHDCAYCYARDIAERFYPEGFTPTFHPERLDAPRNTAVPKGADDDPRLANVFTCSMADLFGKWVPQEWIDAVLDVVVDTPQWRYLMLTKFPSRLATFEWPTNAWVGTSVDRQFRVGVAERAFEKVTAGVKWLSCEPLLEPLTFGSLEMFDWVVIGAQSWNRGTQSAVAPPIEWVVDLVAQARAAGCRIYLKPNLLGRVSGDSPGMVLPQEMPWDVVGAGDA